MSDPKLVIGQGAFHSYGRQDLEPVVLRERTPAEKDAYFAAKIVELVTTQKALAEVTKDRNLLREALSWYADRGNYDHEGRAILNADAPRCVPPLADLGKTARSAIQRKPE